MRGLKILLLPILTLSIGACTPTEGFNSFYSVIDENGSLCEENCAAGDNGNDFNNGPIPELNDWNTVIDIPFMGGDSDVQVGIDQDELDLVIELPFFNLLGLVGAAFPLTEDSDIIFEIRRDVVTNKNKALLRVPLEKILHKLGVDFEEAGLPNGDPLPMIPSGQLPRLTANILDKDVYIYGGNGYFGVYATVGFDPTLNLTWPIKNQNQEIVGYLSTIARKTGFDGGVLITLEMSQGLQDVLGPLLPAPQL